MNTAAGAPSTWLGAPLGRAEGSRSALWKQAPPGIQSTGFGILSPQPGEAVRGLLTIQGTTAVEGFARSEVAFAYAEAPETWFRIAESAAPIENGALARWDTGTITDGDYALRLLITLEDGSQQSMTLEGLRVRNYSPVETGTPTPTPIVTPLHSTPTITPTPVPPLPTPLPPNPAGLSTREALASMGKGALFVLGAFATLGIYQRARSLLRRDR